MYIPHCWLDKYLTFPKNFQPTEITDRLNKLGLETEFNENNWQFTPLSNRQDLFSWWGIVKELNILLNFPLKKNFLSVSEKSLKVVRHSHEIEIKVMSKECRRVDLILLNNFKVRHTNEQWIKKCLESNHIPSINNIVDISNLVMLELGQPSHSYDYDKLPDKKEFIIREAFKGEKFLTLSGRNLVLDQSELVISSGNELICLAGIIGSKKTKIDEKSSSILIEIANFDSRLIWKSSQNLDLITKSSQYFSKKAHLPWRYLAINRFIELIEKEIKTDPIIFNWSEKHAEEIETVIPIEHAFIENKSGVKIELSEIENIWKKLGFNYKKNNGEFLITPSRWRLDLKNREDLLEEIALFLNYNKLPVISPAIRIIHRNSNQKLNLKNLIKQYLANSGYQEICTYSLIDEDSKNFFLPTEATSFYKIINPKNKSRTYYRQNSFSEHLKTIAYNMSHKNKNLFFFEISEVYSPDKREEILTLSGTGKFFDCPVHKLQTEIDFFWIKGTLENLFQKLNILKKISFSSEFIKQMHPYQTASVFLGNERIGFVGQINSLTKQNYQIKQKVFGAHISLNKIEENIKINKEINYKPISLFPQIERDLSFVFEENVKADQVIQLIQEIGGELLAEVRIFDSYEGGEYKKNQQKSLAFHLIFQNSQRTLLSEEIEDKIRKIIDEIKKFLGGELREK